MKKKNIKTHSKKKKARAFLSEKNYQEALSLYEKVCDIDPRDAEAFELKGLCLSITGRKNEAINSLLISLKISPVNAKCNYNLGVIYNELKMFEESIAYLVKALETDPLHKDAFNLITSILVSTQQFERAEEVYRKWISNIPSDNNALANMGVVQQASGKITDAIETYKAVIERDESQYNSWLNMANGLISIGEYDEGMIAYEKCLEKNPDNRTISNYLLSLNYLDNIENKEIYIKHKNYSRMICKSSAALPPGRESGCEIINVGYISSDFRRHSVAYFIEPILKCHNSVKIKVHCYASVPVGDAVTERLKSYSTVWRNIYGLSPNTISSKIKSDKIDILVDLGGHTAGNHLDTLCLRPAPIQVTYLGYPNTTGLEYIDYRITDEISNPVEIDPFYTEKNLRLQRCFLCYQADENAPDVKDLPAHRNGYVTFASFNNLAKIGSYTINLWSEVMHKVKDSRIIIKNPSLTDTKVKQHLIEKFRKNGIEADRIELIGLIESHFDHLDLYNKVDIALDTYPYNGTTTTCEALWMGVPVITLCGDKHASRVGASLLNATGLDFYIAKTDEEYINKAQTISGDYTELMNIRNAMRERLSLSSLMNAADFTNELEELYKSIIK